MIDKIAQLSIPEYGEIKAPPGVPSGGSNVLSNAIGVGIQIFLIVVIITSLLFVLWGGINWIRSEGDAQKIQAARLQIIFAIIGLIVSFIAFGIIGVFSSFFNVKLI